MKVGAKFVAERFYQRVSDYFYGFRNLLSVNLFGSELFHNINSPKFQQNVLVLSSIGLINLKTLYRE